MDKTKNSDTDLMMTFAANTIRCLTIDAIQKANSGHPGMPMGCADLAVVLWLKFLKHNPADPKWSNRDRFVLSAGHGSMLLYLLLHLSGYDLSMSEIKRFRQWGSITPGHPEYGMTPGVETTSGPLGQGFANGVGMAIAERHLAAIFNEPEFPIVNHFTYAIVSDGDLMEGISSEAASLAGHLGLGKLIYIYDNNHITIEGPTSLTFETEDVKMRFAAYGWQTIDIDGHDMFAAEQAIRMAQSDTGRPSLIIAHTHIAQGSPNLHDKAKSHGAPLGIDEVRATKRNLGFPEDKEFYVPPAVCELFAKRTEELKKRAAQWEVLFDLYARKYPKKAALWREFHAPPSAGMLKKISVNFDLQKPIATRTASGKVLQATAPIVKNLIGGSADLAPSNKTYLNGMGDIALDSFEGRNMHFGIREHAMGGILNGLALHGGIIPYGGTFLVFSDYARPAIRLAAFMRLPVIYVFTHDSIFVGEDGPTHQPVEQLAALRTIPGLTVIRPADAMETLEAWKVALKRQSPTAIILTRQSVPAFDRNVFTPASNLACGAYILCGGNEPADCLLIASGSEVSLALDARTLLAEKGIKARVISFASWELFEEQSEEYRKSVLPDDMPVRLVIESGRKMGWEGYVGRDGDVHSIERFGASAPYEVLAEKYGFTAETVALHAEKLLARWRKKLNP